MRLVYVVILLVFVAAIGIFCVQNLESIHVAYLGWSADLPLPLLVLLVYVLGMLSGWGLLSFLRLSIRRATERTK